MDQMDFSQLVLSKAEEKLLRDAAERAVPYSPELSEPWEMLQYYGFIELRVTPKYSVVCAEASNREKAYLRFLQNSRRRAASSRRHDFWIAVVGGIAGSLITLLVEYFPHVLRAVRHLIEVLF